MQPAKKQITALGLLLLTALPLFLSVGLYIKQKIVQNQREERFETELIQTITVSAEKLVWAKPGKEILINGNLFDVKSFKISRGNIILTGFYDNKEDKLVKQSEEIIHQKNDSNSPVNLSAVKFLFYPKYKESINFSIQNNWQTVAIQFPVYAEVISRMAYPAPVPPPKYC